MSGQRRVALITGSTRGIGLCIAQRLASTGYDVILTGLGEPEDIENAVKTVKGQTEVRCDYVGGNFTQQEEIERMCDEILKLYPDGVDVLINNAGLMAVNRIDECPIEIWNNMLAINLTAPFLLIRRFLPYMRNKGWGRIVQISSQKGLISEPGKAHYSATKAGLIGLTKGVALEAAEHGITCNAVCPGFVLTDFFKSFLKKMAIEKDTTYEQLAEEMFAKQHPTLKPITPEQVAGLVGYLCSEEAASITGAAHSIDGGNTAR